MSDEKEERTHYTVPSTEDNTLTYEKVRELVEKLRDKGFFPPLHTVFPPLHTVGDPSTGRFTHTWQDNGPFIPTMRPNFYVISDYNTCRREITSATPHLKRRKNGPKRCELPLVKKWRLRNKWDKKYGTIDRVIQVRGFIAPKDHLLITPNGVYGNESNIRRIKHLARDSIIFDEAQHHQPVNDEIAEQIRAEIKSKINNELNRRLWFGDWATEEEKKEDVKSNVNVQCDESDGREDFE